MIKACIFDWGDTIMRDFPEKEGPAYTWEELIWIDGAEDALQKIWRERNCYIASNSGCSDSPMMIKALIRLGASRYFKDFFTSFEIGFEKPDIRFFSYILSKIPCLPYEAVMIGNNYEKDIIGAKDAGLYTVFFDENSLNIRKDKADILIEQMIDLPEAINQIDKL